MHVTASNDLHVYVMKLSERLDKVEEELKGSLILLAIYNTFHGEWQAEDKGTEVPFTARSNRGERATAGEEQPGSAFSPQRPAEQWVGRGTTTMGWVAEQLPAEENGWVAELMAAGGQRWVAFQTGLLAGTSRRAAKGSRLLFCEGQSRRRLRSGRLATMVAEMGCRTAGDYGGRN
ncbi:hypothetical protein Fot_32309 [Forsythia ovata]|uniref:Uncharacterized protein n=1 Tax=Forsythia ovata TaxID=205694 RepID=A0ABD1T7E5_9LAMI